MSIDMPKSTEATIAIAVNSMASPASIHATGNPVNTNTMKAKNIANASISLAGIEEKKRPESGQPCEGSQSKK